MDKIIITEVEQGARIDKFLAEKLGITRSKIQKLLKESNIKVNGEDVKNKYALQIDDVIEVENTATEEEEITIVGEDIPLNIVYEDDHLLVIDKPSGMVVHPAPGNYTGTLVNALMHYSNGLSDVNGDFRPGIVHRIDKNTSGLLIVAKTNEAHNLLAQMIKDKAVERKYKAIVHGTIKEKKGIIKAPIGRDPKNRKTMIVTDKNAKYAETHFEVIDRNLNYTLVECQLLTGRTHQIRVHFKWIAHPLAGDPEYGPKQTIDVNGQALHSYSLDFEHPITKEHLHFESPLPDYFANAVKEVELKDK